MDGARETSPTTGTLEAGSDGADSGTAAQAAGGAPETARATAAGQTAPAAEGAREKGDSGDQALAQGAEELARGKEDALAGESGDRADAGESGVNGGEERGDGADEGKAWEEFIANIDPGLGIHTETLRGFSEIARKMSLTPEAASELIAWSAEASERARELAAAEGRKELAALWGASMEAYQERATRVVAMVDRELGDNRFRAAIEKYGVCADADFTRGMKYIADMLSEDALGASHDAGGSGAAESPLEALKKFYN